MLRKKQTYVKKEIEKLLQTSQQGKILREGFLLLSSEDQMSGNPLY